MTSQSEKGSAFRALHARPGAFVIPNPWDAGSARMLQGLGFEAVATTSAGFANAFARNDGQMKVQEKIAHCRSLVAVTDIPITADFENGFADDPKQVAENLTRVAEAGVVGASIEDYSGNAKQPIYAFAHAVERIQAAAEAARRFGFPFLLTARAENLLRGVNDLDDTIERLKAYSAAGADVLYAPGLTTLDQVRTVTAAVDKPVNVLAIMVRDATVATLAAAGAKRLSVGGALARAAVTAMIKAGKEMRDAGTFGWTTTLAGGREVSELLR